MGNIFLGGEANIFFLCLCDDSPMELYGMIMAWIVLWNAEFA